MSDDPTPSALTINEEEQTRGYESHESYGYRNTSAPEYTLPGSPTPHSIQHERTNAQYPEDMQLFVTEKDPINHSRATNDSRNVNENAHNSILQDLSTISVDQPRTLDTTEILTKATNHQNLNDFAAAPPPKVSHKHYSSFAASRVVANNEFYYTQALIWNIHRRVQDFSNRTPQNLTLAQYERMKNVLIGFQNKLIAREINANHQALGLLDLKPKIDNPMNARYAVYLQTLKEVELSTKQLNESYLQFLSANEQKSIAVPAIASSMHDRTEEFLHLKTQNDHLLTEIMDKLVYFRLALHNEAEKVDPPHMPNKRTGVRVLRNPNKRVTDEDYYYAYINGEFA